MQSTGAPLPQPFRPTHQTLPANADPLALLSVCTASGQPPSLLDRHDSQRASPPATVPEPPDSSVRDWGRGRVGEDGLVYGGDAVAGRERSMAEGQSGAREPEGGAGGAGGGRVVQDPTCAPARDKALDPSLHRQAPPQAQLHGREFGALGAGARAAAPE